MKVIEHREQFLTVQSLTKNAAGGKTNGEIKKDFTITDSSYPASETQSPKYL
jgi:hypothetical protein